MFSGFLLCFGFLVLSLLLLFVISMVALGFTVFWFLVVFRFCCSCNDVLLGCIVESELHCMVLNGPSGLNALGVRRLFPHVTTQ
jgi:hypothetical protein